jgi:ATPase subunit of ABC transporter with duplicated ATPase domains
MHVSPWLTPTTTSCCCILLPASPAACCCWCHTQFETLAGFSAVIDRLGEFQEVVTAKLKHGKLTVEAPDSEGGPTTQQQQEGPQEEQQEEGEGMAAARATTAAAAAGGGAVGTPEAAPLQAATDTAAAATAAAATSAPPPAGTAAAAAAETAGAAAAAETGIRIIHRPAAGDLLLSLADVCMSTPDGSVPLVQHLDLEVGRGRSLLIMGPSGAGKTSVSGWG